MADETPQTLSTLYQKAVSSRNSLDSAPSPTHSPDLLETISLHEQALSAVSHLQLFSPNESLDDLQTSSLPYLSLPFHLAELLQKLPAPGPSARRDTLSRARAYYEEFLSNLDSYGLFTESQRKLYESYTEFPEEFSTLRGGDADATARRNSKIANYREEKALREKVDALSRNAGVDEDAAREAHLAALGFAAHQTLQALEGMNRELAILAQAPAAFLPQTSSVVDDARRRHNSHAQEEKDGYSERLDRPLQRLQSLFGQGGPVLNAQGKPLQPFTLVGTRQEIANGVFRPGHNLPTMSIDEYLAEEKRRGNIIEGGGEASMAVQEVDEDDVERADQETMKAREWDDFKDENPRGWGNTMNKG